MSVNANTTTDAGQAVATRERYTNAQLRELANYDDIKALAGADIVNIGDTPLSSGFDVLEDKSQLIGTQFVILDWHFSQGDNGRFVSLLVMTKDGSKYVVNDGSTGICLQMDSLGEPTGVPIGVPRGLRVSDYVRKDANGNPLVDEKTGMPMRARTYYLDTSSR